MSERNTPSGSRSALTRAVLAARRAFDGESERERETERRILESMGAKRATRRVFWLAPLAAAFVVSAAFAGELGGHLVELKKQLFADAASTEGAPSNDATSHSRTPPASSVATPAASATAAVPAESVVAQPGAVSAPANIPRAAPLASTSLPPAPSVSSSRPRAVETPDELALYREAHRAHFVDHDYASALAFWDRYLALAPRGTFALEARYNRAIALHRLGRRALAVEALRPFAEGAYGRYRRDEAQALIEQLR